MGLTKERVQRTQCGGNQGPRRGNASDDDADDDEDVFHRTASTSTTRNVQRGRDRGDEPELLGTDRRVPNNQRRQRNLVTIPSHEVTETLTVRWRMPSLPSDARMVPRSHGLPRSHDRSGPGHALGQCFVIAIVLGNAPDGLR